LTVGQMILQPQMFQSAGSMADQTKHLNKLTFNPPPLDTAIEALAGEDTEAMHSPNERQAMSKMGGLMPPPPLDRQRLWNWVDHFRSMLLIMFEDECPLLKPLTTIRQLLYNAPLFGTWGRKNFANLTWRIHQGIRHFFTTVGALSPIVRVANDLMAMHPFAEDTAPPEYLPAAKPMVVPRAPPEQSQKRAAEDTSNAKRQKASVSAPRFPRRGKQILNGPAEELQKASPLMPPSWPLTSSPGMPSSDSNFSSWWMVLHASGISLWADVARGRNAANPTSPGLPHPRVLSQGFETG